MDQIVAAPARSRPLHYDGRVGELYRIFLVSLLLTVLTLGIYRFWAITRYRRYLWSRMSFQGERLEYTGTGGELFVGFLLAGLLVLSVFAGAGVLSYLMHQTGIPFSSLPLLLAYAFVAVLAAGAVFSAQRYRLSRTLWCGIRGGMTGSALAYGARAVLYSLLAVVTLFQLVPWLQVRLAERRIKASGFGDARFGFQGQARRLYPIYLATVLALLLLGLAIWCAILSFSSVDFASLMAGGGTDSEGFDEFVGLVVAGLLLFVAASALASCWYTAAFARHVADRATLGPLRFAAAVTGASLLGLTLGNMLILVATLGLGYPVVLHRNAAFLARTLRVDGAIDPAVLAQSTLPASRFGEGMLQQLDSGGVF